MLRTYNFNPNYVIKYKPLQIQEGLTYKEVLARIVDGKEQVLHTKKILIVKVL